jgi:predicted ATPase
MQLSVAGMEGFEVGTHWCVAGTQRCLFFAGYGWLVRLRLMTSAELDGDKSLRPPRIIRIAVEKLFGSLDHDIKLRRQDRVTILHGINGVGKTKLLELTAALIQVRLDRLTQIPFTRLQLDLDDDTSVEVTQDQNVQALPVPSRAARIASRLRKIVRHHKLTVRRINTRSGQELKALSPEDLFNWHETAPHHPALPPWISPLREGVWYDSRDGEVLTREELIDRYELPSGALQTPTPFQKAFREVVPCTRAHLIETQRLLRQSRTRRPDEEDSSAMVMTVREIAEELRRKISEVQNEFFRKDQELARTLTERVLSATVQADSEGPALRNRLAALHDHRKRLEKVGLLETGTLGPTFAPAQAESLRGDKALMIAVHAEDTEQKFKVLDALATRLELFLFGMNEKLAYPKKLVLTPTRELTVQRHGETISLEQLSSGEQHELVLLYDLAFRIQPNTLVLIDEPELSLHPKWQEQFLDDILKLAKAGEFDVVLATHSPYIIGNRNDLCVELKAEEPT